ncbi:MAG: glycine cleavage system aminomethyltransferase GcvT [Chloroflexi bacterium]|nr:glycine cleavage system aminomethyltransferase GcvT [Chloroflexota bacterium]
MAARNIARTRLPLAPAPDLRHPFYLGRTGRLPAEKPEARPAFDWSAEASDPLAQVQLRGPVWGALLGGLWREGDPLRQTPLHDVHSNDLGARMVPFAGWSMPVYYGGIAEEHAAVRTAAGLFDVGHMGVFAVEGEHAGEFLDLVTTANASRLPNGRAAYTYLLDPTGHPLDDLIIYRLERERYLAVVNAANTEKNWVWLNGVNERQYEIEPGDPWAEAPIQVKLRDLKAEAEGDQRRLDLALQGPRSRDVLARLAPDEESRRRLRRMRAFDVGSFTLAGIDLEVAHTGYTGERVGFELLVHPDAANHLWHAMLDAGFDDGVRPAGLGSRDSTRTEAGLPLYGHELGGELDLTPGDAGFGGFVKLYKPFFIGRSGFMAREQRRTSQIVRFAITDERVPIAREGDPVVDARGGWVGIVTSAALDTNQRQVGMAHVMQRVSEEGTPLRVFAGVSARRGGRATVPRELKRGGRYPLPANAVVVPRFR